MKSWEAVSGSVIIGRPHEGLVDPMSPLTAANLVDQWFPSSSQRALWTLQEIATALGEKFHPSGNDDRELREILKRALYGGKLIAVERAPMTYVVPESPAPAPLPYVPPPQTDEKASIRFRLVHTASFQPITNAKVKIRFADGHEEDHQTDSAGQVFFSAKHGEKFAVTEIDEPLCVVSVKRS